MLSIILVFVASFMIIGSVAYILYTYQDSEVEPFGIPSRTETLVSDQTNCNVPMEQVDETEDDTDEVIRMEDIMEMRNGLGETVQQKITQKASGMGYREGAPGPSLLHTNQASKPENQLSTDSKSGVVWASHTPKPDVPPSHLMGSSGEPTVGGILPGLDREAGSYSSV